MNSNTRKEKILLVHLPYWLPLIPPMGIASLKAILRQRGYRVKTVDLNIEKEFKQLYIRYFDVFKKYIPRERRGNFYNIGHDVLEQHLMAHIHYHDETAYLKLLKIIIDTIFFNHSSKAQLLEHIEIIQEFYQRLENYFLRLFEKETYDVLGCTVYKGTLPAALFVYGLAKRTVPGIKTLMGGGIFASTLIQGTSDMEFFLEKTGNDIDKIMIGRGEPFMLKYLANELPQSQRVFTLEDLEKHGSSPMSSSPPLPDLSDFDLHHYPYLSASGSLGCSGRCSFCNAGIFWGEYRQKPARQTVTEMVKLYQTYGGRIFFMTDALLNPIVPELAKEVSKSGHSLYYDAYFRVDDASRNIDNTLLWRQGGLYRVRLGVESGSQRILDLMGKDITPDQIRGAMAGFAYAGIKPTAYFVIGHPGETEADFQQTLNLLEDIGNDTWQAECSPFYYHGSQHKAEQWQGKGQLLYPENARDMLWVQTRIVDMEPSREELYNRVFRFVNHCKKLGIPNPYTLEEIYQADQRWKKLHPNGAPPLVELMNADDDMNRIIDKSNQVKKFCAAENKQQYGGDFAF